MLLLISSVCLLMLVGFGRGPVALSSQHAELLLGLGQNQQALVVFLFEFVELIDKFACGRIVERLQIAVLCRQIFHFKLQHKDLNKSKEYEYEQ